MRFVGYLFPVAIILSCAPREHRPPPELPPPEELVEESLQNLKVGTFRFDWSLSRLRGQVEGQFSGEVAGERVHLKGEWSFGELREKVELVGIGDTEYRWEEGEWAEAPRGVDTSPLLQLERILSFGQFWFERVEKGCLVYGFKPNLAFLDPSLQAELLGEVWVDQGLVVPRRIQASDREGTLHWELLLHDFGVRVWIQSPTERTYQYILEGTGEFSQISGVVTERLRLLGFSGPEIERSGRRRIRLSLPCSRDPSEEVKQVLKRGVMEVFRAVYPKEPVYTLTEGFLLEEYGEDATLAFEKGDRTKPLVLLERVLSSEDLGEAEIGYDHLSRPYLNICLKEGGVLENLKSRGLKLLAIRVDGEVIAAPKLRELEGGLVVHGGLSIREAEILKAKIETGPLPHELKIVETRVRK